MSLNGSSLNRTALNGAVAVLLLYAECTGLAGASAELTAYKTQFLTSTVNAGVVVSLTPEHTQVAYTNNTGTASGLVDASITYYGNTAATATATGTVFVYRLVLAYSGGDAGATGYALPNSKLAETLASCGAEGITEITLEQRARSTATVSATGEATADRTRLAETTFTGTATGYADWTYQASGETTWLHDAHAWANATNTGTIDETKYKIVAGNGFITTAESAGEGGAHAVFAGRSSSSSGITASVAAVRTAYANQEAVAGAIGQATATYRHMASSNASGTTTYSQVLNKLTVKRTGAAIATAQCFSAIEAMKVLSVHSTNTASCTGVSTAIRTCMAEVSANAGVVVTAFAVSNATIPAPESRAMIVPNELRTMTVPYEDRIMRMAA